MLELSGYRFTTNTEKEIVRKIKEKYSYCILDTKIESDNKFTYILPDGNKINLSNVFFLPLAKLRGKGLK